ncbi:MAG: hypothetical protein H6868_05845 [Rhodospirillales bacterium]|nr:hypothetical protein [Rhodospirillales bacterium]
MKFLAPAFAFAFATSACASPLQKPQEVDVCTDFADRASRFVVEAIKDEGRSTVNLKDGERLLGDLRNSSNRSARGNAWVAEKILIDGEMRYDCDKARYWPALETSVKHRLHGEPRFTNQ